MVVSSGEALSATLAHDLQTSLQSGTQILNLYGSTEVAADITCQEYQPGQQQVVNPDSTTYLHVDPPAASQTGDSSRSVHAGKANIAVGYPIAHMLVMVVCDESCGQPLSTEAQDERGPGSSSAASVAPGGPLADLSGGSWKLCGRGQRGEVWAAGPGVAAGYFGRPQLTAERFCSVPAASVWQWLQTKDAALLAGQGAGQDVSVAADAGASLTFFRMGDIGWVDEAGALHVTDRQDLQAKIRGGCAVSTRIKRMHLALYHAFGLMGLACFQYS